MIILLYDGAIAEERRMDFYLIADVKWKYEPVFGKVRIIIFHFENRH